MKKRQLMTSLTLVAFGVIAKPQTITLEVPSMNCPVCPITVTKSLQRVKGVTDVEVMFQVKEAQVSYDDEITTPAALIEATTNAGYPSHVKSR